MLVCAVLAATLAVQPALGGKGTGKGHELRANQVTDVVAPPPAGNSGPGSAAPAVQVPAVSARVDVGAGAAASTRRSDRGASGGRRATPTPPAPPAGNTSGSGPQAQRGGGAAVTAGVRSGEQREETRPDREPADPEPPATEPDVEPDDESSGRGRGRGRGGRTPAPTESVRPPAPPAENVLPPATPVANPAPAAPVAATAQPAAPAGAVPAPAPAPTATPTPGAAAPTAPSAGADRQAGSPQRPRSGAARGAPAGADGPGLTGSTGGAGTTPATALGTPLRPPATAVFEQATTPVGVRPSGPVSTSRPRPGATAAVPALEEPPSGPIERVVREVVNVVPTWVWIALAALSALVLALGAHTILAAARTRRIERHRAELMEDVGTLQEALLPEVPTRMGALLTTVAYRPADGPAAGGDFYDAFAVGDGRVGVLLGDVSGHGREALAKTALVRFTVRAHLLAGMSPRGAIAVAGRSLDGGLADDFATVLAAVHDPAAGTLTYASAGHPPPIVLGPPAHAPVTASSAPPIGVGFPTGQRQTVLPMPEGTTVAIYSDGLLEARVDGVPLGADRLAAWLADLGPDATAKQLLDLVVERADRVPDDLAAVVLHAAPGATAPAARIEQLKLDVLDVEGPDLEGFLRAAGVGAAERARIGRRVSEQLAVTSGVVVEVLVGEYPTVSVSPIGDRGAASRSGVRAR